MKRTLLLISLTALSLQSYGAVYQCEVNGQLAFSDRPCGDDAREVEVRSTPMVGGSLSTEAGEAFVEQRGREREVSQIDRRISRIQDEIEDLRRNRDAALARWQREKAYANNNLAGATWENSLAKEAEVLRQRYQDDIRSLEAEVANLRDRRQNIVNSY